MENKESGNYIIIYSIMHAIEFLSTFIFVRWVPRITELIENISHNFSKFMARLGCAGEVSLDKAEQEDDFSKYGIIIFVRFRDNDRLRELTAEHQSGGERSICTALYILALQSLTAVPFRCVDEINQV